jgi:hypothetical protein
MNILIYHIVLFGFALLLLYWYAPSEHYFRVAITEPVNIDFNLTHWGKMYTLSYSNINDLHVSNNSYLYWLCLTITLSAIVGLCIGHREVPKFYRPKPSVLAL